MLFDLLDNLIQTISFIMTSKLKDPNSDVNWLITLSPENKLIARFWNSQLIFGKENTNENVNK